MKTKRIKTKKMRLIYVLDLIVLLLCIYRTRFFLSFIIDTYNAIKSFNYSPVILALLSFYTVWLFLLELLIKNFIILAIYLAYRIPRVRSIKNNSKYEVIDNILYYRERFKNITPSEISLLTDLEIETKKDLAASTLDLYNQKIISFDKKKIIINKYDENKLRESSKFLINMLKDKNFKSETVKIWKNLCKNEAIEDNLIKEKDDKVKPFGFITGMSIASKWFTVLLISIGIGICYVATPHFKHAYEDITEFSLKTENLKEDEAIKLIKTDKEFRKQFITTYRDGMPLAILGSVMFVSIIALISMPVYLKVRKVTHKYIDENDKYERTSEGKILVEQIIGMKNFIHDFSNLSENEKESIILWNEFLIYAVLLEENDKIIKDIFNYKKIDTEVLELVNTSININN